MIKVLFNSLVRINFFLRNIMKCSSLIESLRPYQGQMTQAMYDQFCLSIDTFYHFMKNYPTIECNDLFTTTIPVYENPTPLTWQMSVSSDLSCSLSDPHIASFIYTEGDQRVINIQCSLPNYHNLLGYLQQTLRYNSIPLSINSSIYFGQLYARRGYGQHSSNDHASLIIFDRLFKKIYWFDSTGFVTPRKRTTFYNLSIHWPSTFSSPRIWNI